MVVLRLPRPTVLLIAGAFLSGIEASCSGYAGSCGSKFSGGSCRSLEGCSWRTMTATCSGSPRSCSSYTSESSCNGSFGSCFWNEGDESDETESSPKTKCGGSGDAFQSNYIEKYETFKPICTCTPEDRMVCHDQCKRCNSQGVCAKSWKSEHYDTEDHFGGTWTSYIFEAEENVKDAQDGGLLVEYYLYPSGISPGDLCQFNIGDQNLKCNSCSYKLCILSDARRGFDLDCSNLGYGDKINTCEETNLGYPFQLLNGMERFSLMTNAQAKDCKAVEGASSGTFSGGAKWYDNKVWILLSTVVGLYFLWSLFSY